MSPTRTLVIAAAVLLSCAAEAAAQFETPNRAFHNAYAFRLEGRHQAVPCESCHLNRQFAGTPRTCYECHWLRRKDDRYQTRLGTQCEQCHRPTSWSAVQWDHGAMTGLRLNAAHRQLGCESCHKRGEFRGAAPTCASCHQADYDRTQAPAHAAAGFPLTCDSCHSAGDTTWRSNGGRGFNHNQFYPLVGVHASQPCATCHKNRVYKGTPQNCVGCHQPDYNRAQNPNHATAGFPTTCDSCHRSSDPQWKGAAFNHNEVFPLVGVHGSQACATCHKNNLYKGTPRDCVGCHQPDFNRAQNPNHVTAGFPTTCESCHRPSDPQWQGGAFNHNQVFPLVGVHGSQACATCHKNNVYKGTPRDCVGCHQPDYNRAQNPNHATAGFPTTCESCHRPSDPQWQGGAFNHNQVFPLVGVHGSQACATCHKNNAYKGTPRDCVGCHQPDYNRAQNPNHVTAGFPTSCESCHRPSDPQWTGGTFNHNQFFSLVGVHASQACAACHTNNVYKGTPRDCVGCHRTNYDRTTNPNHAAAGFPTTCDSCHRPTDSSWQQGTFNHTQFPLTDRHNVPCVQCHTTSGNFQVFSCIVCHERSKTDGDHRAVNGYRYDSAACYACHPRGRH